MTSRDIRLDVGVDAAGRPAQGAEQEPLVHGVFPDVLAVAHRGVEDAALAVGPAQVIGKLGRWYIGPFMPLVT